MDIEPQIRQSAREFALDYFTRQKEFNAKTPAPEPANKPGGSRFVEFESLPKPVQHMSGTGGEELT